MSENENKTAQANRPRHKGPGAHGGPPGMMPVEKAKDFKGSVSKLSAYLKPYLWKIILVMIFAISSCIFTIISPKILAKATNALFSGLVSKLGGGAGIDFGYIGKICIGLIALYIISAVFSYLQGFTMSGISMKVTYNLRNEIIKKINRMPLGYFDKTSHGEVLSRVTNDVDTLSQSLNQSITQIITSVTTVIGILIMMLTISVKMTLVSLLIIPVSMIFIAAITKHSRKYFKAQQDYLGHVNGHIEEMYGGHTVMKAFGGETRSIKKFSEYNDELYKSAWKSQFLAGLMMPIMTFVGNLGYVVICIMGGFMAAANSLGIGEIQAFIQYVRQFTQPLSQIANISNVLQQAAAAAERVFEFLEEEEEPADNAVVHFSDGSAPDTDTCFELNGSVSFAHIKFGYTPDKIIVNDFSAVANPGQKVAIVGPTGAGKTTIVKLLMRFYDVNEGAILVDGYDIRDFSRNELRDSFGMVLQDTWLFNGTIMENIRYGRPNATDEEVIEAAKAAQADHFIRALPDSYNMVLNEEASNVSQGQKQLLTIARAILSEPKLLILDEATSSVDTRTEVLIQKAMDKLMENRTSFIIAHRLSTIKNADLILCMKDGDIVEKGSHEELMKLGGFYCNLYNSQFERVG